MVDDGSSDDTCAIVEDYVRSDPRFRLIRQQNAGVGAARNSAIREARGRYIAPLDADDLWSPHKLQLQIDRLESTDARVGLVYCWSHRIDADGHCLGFSHPYQVEGDLRRSMIMRHFIGNASIPLIHAAALKEVGLYLTAAEQNGAQGCEDWDLHLRIAERFEVRVVPEYLVGYRQTTSCMSTQARKMAQSYRVVMARARSRNPELPRCLFRWSAGGFYWYLARKCHRCRNDAGALWSLCHAITADFTVLANRRLYRIVFRSAAHLLTGGLLRRLKPPRSVVPVRTVDGPPPAGPKSWHQKLQARRWVFTLGRPAAPQLRPAGPPDAAQPESRFPLTAHQVRTRP